MIKFLGEYIFFISFAYHILTFSLYFYFFFFFANDLLAEYSQLFAFHFTPSNELANESKESSWEILYVEKDYDRMGIKDSNWFQYDVRKTTISLYMYKRTFSFLVLILSV